MNWLWGNDAASSTLQEIEASVRVLTTASSVPEKRDALINLRAAPESSEACELIGHAIPAIVALLKAAASLEVDLLRSALELLIQLIRIPDSKADLLSDVGGGAAASGAAASTAMAQEARRPRPPEQQSMAHTRAPRTTARTPISSRRRWRRITTCSSCTPTCCSSASRASWLRCWSCWPSPTSTFATTPSSC